MRTIFFAMVSLTSALKLSPHAAVNRRGALSRAVAASIAIPTAASAAVSPCPNGANNCWSTAGPGKNLVAKWVFPSGASGDEAKTQMKAVLTSYPQEGQAGVDLGGWSIAEDALAGNGYARFEYKSGIGNFAKFFNGGKPFVDDLEVSFEDGYAAVRSSSRVGDSDFGVNGKRLNYIAAGLRAKGWDAPGVSQ